MPAAGVAAPSRQLPEHMETQRTQVLCGPDLNYHVSCLAIIATDLGTLSEPKRENCFADIDIDLCKHVYGSGHKQCLGFPGMGRKVQNQSTAKG